VYAVAAVVTRVAAAPVKNPARLVARNLMRHPIRTALTSNQRSRLSE